MHTRMLLPSQSARWEAATTIWYALPEDVGASANYDQTVIRDV